MRARRASLGGQTRLDEAVVRLVADIALVGGIETSQEAHNEIARKWFVALSWWTVVRSVTCVGILLQQRKYCTEST